MNLTTTMNILDFILILGTLAFLLNSRKLSFVYYLCSDTGIIIGYIFGLVAAPFIVQHISRDLHKGLVTLGLLLLLPVLCWFLGTLLGRKLRIQIIESRFFKADKLLALPFKAFLVLVAIICLAQSLVHVPILAVQFEAQGSSILYLTNKLVPDSGVTALAKRIAPDQFSMLHLDYDSYFPTYNHIKNAGEFQDVVNKVAPSVVKVSGKTCIGLGFGSGYVVAPKLVLTNAHVVTGSSTIYISDHKGSYPATPIVIDYDKDIAVLYSEFIDDPILTIAPQSEDIGSTTIVLGYPYAEDLVMTTGKVNEVPKEFQPLHVTLTADEVTFSTATVAGGNSGGPMINTKGEVIGMASAGNGTGTYAINPKLLKAHLEKAKSRLIPNKTGFCATSPKYF